MNYTTLYTSVAIARTITLKLAKVLTLILGLQFAILYLLASISNDSFTGLIGPALRVLAAVAVVILAPRLFDAAQRRIVEASRRAK
jgi:4-amino-4-deoxy-L-arabinose transferase-like glycosyltransferase